MVGSARFELAKAMPIDLQSIPFDHFGNYPFKINQLNNFIIFVFFNYYFMIYYFLFFVNQQTLSI